MSAVIPIGRQFLTVDELIGLGLTYYKINRLVDEGKLVKVSKSMYENTAFDGDMSDFSIVRLCAQRHFLHDERSTLLWPDYISTRRCGYCH